MDEVTNVTQAISTEQVELAIDLLVAMVVEELSCELQQDANTVLVEFINSKTGQLLYDASSKFWWNGPSYICEVYKDELNSRRNI